MYALLKDSAATGRVYMPCLGPSQSNELCGNFLRARLETHKAAVNYSPLSTSITRFLIPSVQTEALSTLKTQNKTLSPPTDRTEVPT